MKDYRFSIPGELKVRGYCRDLTEYVTKKQLTDEGLWKLFVNQYKIHSDKNGEWKGEFWGKTMRGACLTYISDKNERLYKVLVAQSRICFPRRKNRGAYPLMPKI